MAARTFIVNRRRPNLVDALVYLSGADQYRLKWAPNFDTVGPWTTITTSPPGGWKDPNVDRRKLEVLNIGGHYCRIAFDPASFTIPDTTAFWLVGVPVTGGIEGTSSAPALVLPYSAVVGNMPVTVAGNAPNALTIAGSQQIDLPAAMFAIHLRNNDGANAMFVATDGNGPEFKLPAGETLNLSVIAGAPSLWVRGDGGAVPFSAILTQAV